MPKSSDIILSPAPKGWKPSPDEAGDIANDPQLQRMTRDEQYHYLKNRRGGSSGSVRVQRGSASKPADKKKPAKKESSGYLGGLMNHIAKTMGGN